MWCLSLDFRFRNPLLTFALEGNGRRQVLREARLGRPDDALQPAEEPVQIDHRDVHRRGDA